MAATDRVGVCLDCSAEVRGGKAGRMPERCKACKRRRETARVVSKYVPVVNVRTCADCGIAYRAPGRDTKSLRCPPCRKRNKADWQRQWDAANKDRVYAAKRKWHEANRDYVKSVKHRRRVLARGADADRFISTDVFDRDQWTCQLCGAALLPSSSFPDPLSASVDHIIPIAAGGTHTWDNVQAACMGCNWSKGSRLAS